MKQTILKVLTIACTAASLSMVAVAEDAGHEDSDGSELGAVMEEMGGAFKKLARAMRAPKAADVGMYQTQVAIMKKQAIKAKGLVPELVEEAGAEKSAKATAYQKSMKEFISMLENLEIVLAKGDLAMAQTVVNKLNTARKQGHKDFKKPDEE